MDFYLTLPASVASDPKNTSSRFTTRLPETLSLKKGRQVIGLTDIIYPCSNTNVNSDTSYTITLKDGGTYRVIIPNGHYGSGEHIEEILRLPKRSKRKAPEQGDGQAVKNDGKKAKGGSDSEPILQPVPKLATEPAPKSAPPRPASPAPKLAAEPAPKSEPPRPASPAPKPSDQPPTTAAPPPPPAPHVSELVRFEYKDVINRMQLEINADYVVKVELEPDLAYFLGYSNRVVTQSTTADRPIDFYNNISTMYIYSDVVDFSIVGNAKTNLLQCCPLSGTYGQMIQHTFNPVRYLPISRDTIDTVKIDILSEFGKLLNFNWGSTIVTLHIKTL